MKFKKWQFTVQQHKNYFDSGFGLLSFFKYLIGIFAANEVFNKANLKVALYIAIGYGIFCYFIGMIYWKKGFKDAEIEVSNRANPFVDEVRVKLIDKKV